MRTVLVPHECQIGIFLATTFGWNLESPRFFEFEELILNGNYSVLDNVLKVVGVTSPLIDVNPCWIYWRIGCLDQKNHIKG
jgi:hypothetical protein